MSFFYNRQQDQTLPLPHGYQYNQNPEVLAKQTNHQYFLTQAANHSPQENDIKLEIIPKGNQIDHLTPQRNRIFEELPDIKVRKELSQTRYKSTPGKRHRIFEQDNSVDLTHQKIEQKQVTRVSNHHNNNIKSLLLQEIETIKQKSQLYQGTYQQLLQKLIQIVETKQDDLNLRLDPEFNNIIFKIRTLQGLDFSDKIQIEKIIKQIVNQDDKLLFQGLVKELIQNEWMYWIEPLYYDVQKQQIPKEKWKSFIEKQKSIYKFYMNTQSILLHYLQQFSLSIFLSQSLKQILCTQYAYYKLLIFNSYQYEKQLALSKEIDKIKKGYMREREVRKGTSDSINQELNNRFAQNYRKRVENFVINMFENPVVCTEYKQPTTQAFREEDPTKNLGDPQFYVKGFKHQKDLIQEALERNKDLDFLPNRQVVHYCFRERDPSKDIKRDVFRYRDKTSLGRIKQFLKDHTQTQVGNQKFSKKKVLNMENLSENMSSLDRKAYLSRLIAKNLLPSLHQKTHFQATATMFNNLPLSLMDHARSAPLLKQAESEEKKSQQQQREVQKTEEMELKDNKIKQGNELETFNPVETSKSVLEKFNVIRSKNPKISTIHKGQGHLISTLDKSIRIFMEQIQVKVNFQKMNYLIIN
ncbi:unnamed protein product (macronuclear) [Paramecium tetraurelia]|uniref:Uncharacterized protein n=1 Tax=Paramecium tetraurelia TaxID=5888 RepID=A0E8N5_PARTE|nr:uncharacterized protein GSPATT00024381001 [Paramecium tetraurelia]CAK91652.1 unnamed protein product [Paramecium tetraurelia]|eukprot:XP_001459049.1 hypothetical protein (macronuclear) [Paramecium tetraurelia strain d4-2]